VSLLAVVIYSLGVLTVTSSIIAAVRAFVAQVVTTRMNSALSLAFFNHLQHLPVRFFDGHRVGEVTSRLGDVRAVLTTLSRVFESVLMSFLYLLIIPPILLLINWRLAILSILAVPATTAVAFAFGRYLQPHWKRTAEAVAELQAVQLDLLSNIRTLKLLGAERETYRKVARVTETGLSIQLFAGSVSNLSSVINSAIRACSIMLCTWFSWSLILRGQMTLGAQLSFAAYLGYLTGPLGQLSAQFSELQRSAISLRRVFEYLDTETDADPQSVHRSADTDTESAPVRIGFLLRDVSFAYSEGRRIFENLHLELRVGVSTALVGPSGAGKSTLLRLLSAIDTPESGAILLDNRHLHEWPRQTFRKEVSTIWQENGLIRGTLWENLTLGAPQAQRSDVEAALTLVKLNNYVSALTDGLDTPLAEWGASLSAGQRQRLVLARALVRRPSVLLLDEAMANVDQASENSILVDILQHLRGRTLVFVTHRIGTARLADSIVVLADGRVVGTGSHDFLIETCEVYRSLQVIDRPASGEPLLGITARQGAAHVAIG
jgi:ABC-type bacteriocin/lantibiotic exporter with double-glycine peptidase domain